MNNEKQKKTNRTTLFAPLADESGAILIITMIILLLLTLIGISGINTASTDIQITSNYRIHNLNLACADGAVNRAKSRIAYGKDKITDLNKPWFNDIKKLYTADSKYYKNGTWDGSDTTVLNAIAVDKVIEDWGTILEITPEPMPSDANVEFVVYINTNSPEGNSVVIAKSKKNGGVVIIEAGFNQQ